MNFNHQQQLLNGVIRDYYPDEELSESPSSEYTYIVARGHPQPKNLTQLENVSYSLQNEKACYGSSCNCKDYDFTGYQRNQASQQSPCALEFMPESCEVCGDKSSGTHYGIFSCEGCKVCFFLKVVCNELIVLPK